MKKQFIGTSNTWMQNYELISILFFKYFVTATCLWFYFIFVFVCLTYLVCYQLFSTWVLVFTWYDKQMKCFLKNEVSKFSHSDLWSLKIVPEYRLAAKYKKRGETFVFSISSSIYIGVVVPLKSSNTYLVVLARNLVSKQTKQQL